MSKITTVDEYINSFPEPIQKVLKELREILHGVVPEATEAISYAIPVLKVDGKYLVYFAGFKGHVSVYPRPQGDDGYQEKIKPYASGRGTLQFSLEKPLPRELIQETVRFMRAERGLPLA